MKCINKGQVPDCLQVFIAGQLAIEPEPVNLSYDDFRAKPELLAILTAEQFGLCGYTGAPIDESRISKLKAPSEKPAFKNHIEHLKCQSVCKKELLEAGQVFGRDFCQDLDYANMIAALEVRGAENEQFGAVIKADHLLPVLPIDAKCEKRFRYRENDAVVDGVDDDAKHSVGLLKLNHETLKGWRLSAIETWLAPDAFQTKEDLEKIISAVTMPKNGTLPEFAFVIEAVARSYIDEANV
jgi:hypothetical protein